MCLIVQKLKVPHIYFSNIDTQELPVGAKHINLVFFLQLWRLYSTFGTIFMFMKVRVRTRKGENLFNDGNKKWKNISTCISGLSLHLYHIIPSVGCRRYRRGRRGNPPFPSIRLNLFSHASLPRMVKYKFSVWSCMMPIAMTVALAFGYMLYIF